MPVINNFVADAKLVLDKLQFNNRGEIGIPGSPGVTAITIGDYPQWVLDILLDLEHATTRREAFEILAEHDNRIQPIDANTLLTKLEATKYEDEALGIFRDATTPYYTNDLYRLLYLKLYKTKDLDLDTNNPNNLVDPTKPFNTATNPIKPSLLAKPLDPNNPNNLVDPTKPFHATNNPIKPILLKPNPTSTPIR